GKGIAKVILDPDIEVQVDSADGTVLSRAVRRSDWIESIHDGSFFGGDIGKLGVFLPSAIGLLLLWISGIWMFVLPFVVRARKRRRAAAGGTARP
ncbi:MAG: PepSY domain-containing protein, partial [Armatimonadaceae bacterium]